MPQQYKLRLGDGTVLSVDSDGLRTWAGDGRATVQAVGSWRWQPLQEVLAEEAAAARLARALVPPKPRQEVTPPPPAPAAPAPPPLELPEFDLGAPPAESIPTSRPSLQALADDPMSSRAPDPAAVESSDDLPIIPMKPLDDEPVFQSAWSGTAEEDEEAEEYVEDERRQDRLDGALLTVLETGGGFLSRVLHRLTPLANRLTARRADDSGPHRAAVEDIPRKRAVPPAAAPTVLTLAEDPAASRDAWDNAEDAEDDRPSFLARASGFLRDLGARLRRPAEDDDDEEAEEEPPAPRQPAAWTPPPPAARQPVAAPTPLSELPALRFVESREPRGREDVYAGDEPARSWNLRPLWDWTKRIVTTGALVAALAYAVVERDTWLPRTAEVGQTVFTQIDRQVLARERQQQQERALADASARLPELTPETIQLVFARSPTGIAEPGEVFQVAREAADRGMGALTDAEAQELRELARELLATLSRTEAERVREYDRTRARRVIFPFENPHVMDLVARGARSLPAERLERLRALSHEAVAAGLDLPEPTGAPSAVP